MKKFILVSVLVMSYFSPAIEASDVETVVFDDGTQFKADRATLETSSVLKNLLEATKGKELPISGISSATFKKLYEFMQITKEEKPALRKIWPHLSDPIEQRAQTLDLNTTKELLIAADFFNIKRLIEPFINHFVDLLVSNEQLKKMLKDPITFMNKIKLNPVLDELVRQKIMGNTDVKKIFIRIIERAPRKIETFCAGNIKFSSESKILGECEWLPSGDFLINSWDPKTGKSIDTFVGGQLYYNTTTSPDGSMYLSTERRLTKLLSNTVSIEHGYGLVLHKYDTGEPLRKFGNAFNQHDTWISFEIFSPDGSLVASGSNDGALKLWDTKTGNLLRNFTGGHKERITSIAISSDNSTLVSIGYDNAMKIWDIKTGDLLRSFDFSGYLYTPVAISPSNLMFAASGKDSSKKEYNIDIFDMSVEQMPLDLALLLLALSIDPLKEISQPQIDIKDIQPIATNALEKIDDEDVKQSIKKYIEQREKLFSSWWTAFLYRFRKAGSQFE